MPDILADDDVQMGSPQGPDDIYVDYDDSHHRVSPPESTSSDSETADCTSGFKRNYHPLIDGM